MNVMINTVGHRKTDRALQLGELYSPEQALSIGLIDKIEPLDSVVKSAEDEMARWLKIPGTSFLHNHPSITISTVTIRTRGSMESTSIRYVTLPLGLYARALSL